MLTGGGGFVGRWLGQELRAHGHEVVAPERAELDVADRDQVGTALREHRPEAVVHLAAVAYAPDAGADPESALAINLGGTINLLEAIRVAPERPVVLITGSSEVYGTPRPADLPLTEDAPLAPHDTYAFSKVAQEAVAIAYAQRHDLTAVATRSFNHSGPGQRPVFVLPALAGRVAAVRYGEATSVLVGNLDVRRDFTDVRDVVRAYRLILEQMRTGKAGQGGLVLNVCSGRSLAIRDLLERLCRLAGVSPEIVPDVRFIRPTDAPEIRGDASALRRLTGWTVERSADHMVADVWADVVARREAGEGDLAAG